MEKLYKKDETWFAVIWIIAYVVLVSAGDAVSEKIGLIKSVTLVLCGALSVAAFMFIKKNGLMEYYGLCKGDFDGKKWLYFLPLIAVSSVNLWCGLQMNHSVLESVLYAASMVFVGFFEEVIFRGFLFRGMCRNNMKAAIIVSSLTFGMGHIVNLLNGRDFVPTMLQIIYATAIGFMFTMIFVKSGSIIPCILSHIAVNATSTFSTEKDMVTGIAVSLIITVLSAGYGYYLLKKFPDKIKGE